MPATVALVASLSDWTGVLILAGLIALTITLGRLIRRHGAKEGVGPGEGLEPGGYVRRGSGGAVETEARLRETSGRLMAEIETLGREVRGQTETRIRVLNELLARADGVMSRMQGAEPAPQPPRFEEVYRLADEGADAAAIAERTDFERGEVELILSLRRPSTGPDPDGSARSRGGGARSNGGEL